MASAWKYSKEGVMHGPVSGPEVAALVRTGGLGPDDLVWNADLGAWRPVKEVRDLLAAEAGPVGLRPPVPQPMTTTATTMRIPVAEELSEAPPLEEEAVPPSPRVAGGGGGGGLWRYSRSQRLGGPVSEGELARMIAGGELRPEDLVFGPGLHAWMPVSAVGAEIVARQRSPGRRGLGDATAAPHSRGTAVAGRPPAWTPPSSPHQQQQPAAAEARQGAAAAHRPPPATGREHREHREHRAPRDLREPSPSSRDVYPVEGHWSWTKWVLGFVIGGLTLGAVTLLLLMLLDESGDHPATPGSSPVTQPQGP